MSSEKWRGHVALHVCELFRWLTDVYIIDFSIDDRWAKIPGSWKALEHLSDVEWAAVLDDRVPPCSVSRPLPLALQCLRVLQRSCAAEEEREAAAEWAHELASCASLVAYDRRGVKEKKRGEIERLVPLVAAMRGRQPFSTLVDVGAGVGHLTRAISRSIDGLAVRAVEANASLVSRAVELDARRDGENGVSRLCEWVDERSAERLLGGGGQGEGDATSAAVCLTGLHACGDLSPSILRLATRDERVVATLLLGCCYHKLNGGRDKLHRQVWEEAEATASGERGFPMSARFARCELSYAARELACHSNAAFVEQLRAESAASSSSRHHAYRAAAEWAIVQSGGRRHLGLRGWREGEDVVDYVRRVADEYPEEKSMLEERLREDASFASRLAECVSETSARRLRALYCMRLLVAPAVERLILADRSEYLRDCGFKASVVPLFDAVKSPRRFALIGMR